MEGRRGGGENRARVEAAGQVMVEIEASKRRGTGWCGGGGAEPLSETLWKERGRRSCWGRVGEADVEGADGDGDGGRRRGDADGAGGADGLRRALLADRPHGPLRLRQVHPPRRPRGRLAANAFMSGTVLLNGRKAKLSLRHRAAPRSLQAYVTQDDNLIGTLTVRETISYSARLRLPDKMPREEKRALVEGTIVEMACRTAPTPSSATGTCAASAAARSAASALHWRSS
uniref:Uncharacterized protein n=1 Tax=Ananas comosus var. bracteatus TaxID=296719 RepID=A0A6V7PZS5_ANACO|nr:unnamed protein product [Ananas comosus var. bracteatus]